MNAPKTAWTGMVPVDDTALAVTDSGGRHHGEEQSPASARLTALIETRLRAAGIGIGSQVAG